MNQTKYNFDVNNFGLSKWNFQWIQETLKANQIHTFEMNQIKWILRKLTKILTEHFNLDIISDFIFKQGVKLQQHPIEAAWLDTNTLFCMPAFINELQIQDIFLQGGIRQT